jgi:hypothetical protein
MHRIQSILKTIAVETRWASVRRMTTDTIRLLHDFDRMSVGLKNWPLASGVDSARLTRLGDNVSAICGRPVSEVRTLSLSNPGRLEWVFRLGWRLYSQSPANSLSIAMKEKLSNWLSDDLKAALEGNVHTESMRIRPVLNRQLGDWTGDVAVRNLQEGLLCCSAAAIAGVIDAHEQFADFSAAFLDGLLPFAWTGSGSSTFFVIVA